MQGFVPSARLAVLSGSRQLRRPAVVVQLRRKATAAPVEEERDVAELERRVAALEAEKRDLEARLTGEKVGAKWDGDQRELVIQGVDARVRNDWTREEIQEIFDKPLMDLVFNAAAVHRVHFDPLQVQKSTLLSIKTGGCTEDCGYCSQSSFHKTSVKPTPTLKLDEVLEAAKRAKQNGSTRFCMGAAWREVGNKKAFNRVLEMVKEINSMGLETCTTLGMLDEEQAEKLKKAGLTAYSEFGILSKIWEK